MSWIPHNWQGQYAKHRTCTKLQDEFVQSGSECFIALTRLQCEDAFSPPYLNQLKAAFRELTQHDRGGNTSHQLSSDPSRWIRSEIDKLQRHSQMKGGWLAGEFRMRPAGQTEIFRDLKTHVSCTIPPLENATNSVKLKCSSPFIYFTFIQYKSKLDLN